jgi:CubicO group peptidase (beta-lactamase class C family)
VRLLPALAVLCQLSLASLAAASGSTADSGRLAAYDNATTLERIAPSHTITTDYTDSGSAVTIDHTDAEVSVTIDGSDTGRSASTRGTDVNPSDVIYLNNANLPGGPDLKLASPPVSGDALDLGRSATIDQLLERAIAQNLIEGGVAVVGNHSGILSSTSRGRLTTAAGSPAITERTIFDLASLTKVIATTPAVMKLLDEGRIALEDPLSRWFPEFADPGHQEITILHLLTHTSGLDDVGVPSDQPMQSAIRKAAAQRGHARLGSRFHYADINFILLGELVRRVSGETLNAFCQEQIYGPLGTVETMFLPPQKLASCIAPTSGGGCGIVQDPNARRLGGVAGHAGLFSSAHDLSRFARMILGGGMLDNRRVLSEQIVAQMISPYVSNNGAVKRGLGWDISSPFSAPKGNFFSQSSFGHTGYSGSSIWIDPQQDLFVILLTNRVNYRDTHNFNQLRRDVSTVAAVNFRTPGSDNSSSPVELAKFNAELLREVTRAVRAKPRAVKLALVSGRTWQQMSRAERRACKAGKLVARNAGRRGAKSADLHRGNRSVRSAELHRSTRSTKAQVSKAAGSSKKRRSQGRRA